MRSSVNPKEIEHFAKDSKKWWDEAGPFAVLHRLQPARMRFIKDQICGHFGRDNKSLTPFKGLSVLDIGCGGGLVSEPMARLGALVTGIDADAQAIEVAAEHAKMGDISIDYMNITAEELLLNLAPSPLPSPKGRGGSKNSGAASPLPQGEGAEQREVVEGPYDILLALEILEHIESPQDFINACAKLLKPGGLAIFSTLNRTPQSLVFGIGAAEYLLGWVPRGTHKWRQFITPAELAGFVRQAGLAPKATSGLVFRPLNGGFALSSNRLEINYFLAATKPY
jgi:2-polyprenyl-6-hydroxyphenyl methylase/3-demethylubiquinone-9 3-methyltransferase